MAVANMLGSNLFNMAIIPIDDLLYTPGPLLNAVSTSHLITAGAVILMTGVFIAGLHARPRRYLRVNWCSLLLIVLFLIQAYLSYTMA
jgi:cation:H+ antiporter